MLYLVPPSPDSTLLTPDNFSKKHAKFIKQINAPGFFCEFKENASRHFSFYAQDTSHGLVNSFSLVIQDSFNPSLPSEILPVLVCDFPTTDMCQLSKIVLGDEYLEAILSFLFHLKVLKALFLFAMDKKVENLILVVDRDYTNWIHAYRDFIVSKEQVTTKKGQQTQITISADAKTYDGLIELMDTMNDGFRQSLWREQSDNPAIRLYLKSHALIEL